MIQYRNDRVGKQRYQNRNQKSANDAAAQKSALALLSETFAQRNNFDDKSVKSVNRQSEKYRQKNAHRQTDDVQQAY